MTERNIGAAHTFATDYEGFFWRPTGPPSSGRSTRIAFLRNTSKSGSKSAVFLLTC
jgi:hypothetical protein